MLFAFWQTGHDESGWLEESWTCFTMSRYKINSIHQTFVGCQTLNPKKTATGHSNGAPVSPAAPGTGLVQQRSQEMGMDHEIPYFLRWTGQGWTDQPNWRFNDFEVSLFLSWSHSKAWDGGMSNRPRTVDEACSPSAAARTLQHLKVGRGLAMAQEFVAGKDNFGGWIYCLLEFHRHFVKFSP